MSVTSNSFDTQNNSSKKVLLDSSELYRNWKEKISGLKIIYNGEFHERGNTFQKFIFTILSSNFLIYMLVIPSISFGIVGIIVAFNLLKTNQTDEIIAPTSMGMVWGVLFAATAGLLVVPSLYVANGQIFLSFKKKTFRRKTPN